MDPFNERFASNESGDDSDIEEIAIIPPKENTDDIPLSPLKRRRSSPLLDPLPTYNPTPLHILEQRAKTTSIANFDNITYSPLPIERDFTSTYQRSSTSHESNNFICNQTAAPNVVGLTTIRDEPTKVTRSQITRRTPASNSSSALRPVSRELAEAVARRRNSQTDKEPPLAANQRDTQVAINSSTSYAEKPIMWSPKPPSQIKSPKRDLDTEESVEKYTSPRVTKKRIAHKPTVPINKGKKPKQPLGVYKKIPTTFRIKYLDVIINEFLNTGHDEDESYEQGLKEEQALASRAATKSIYMNLVAGFKKKLREKAGISTLPQDSDPKYVNGNKVVSHSEILTGKVTGTFSIERKRKTSDPCELNEYELYDRLLRYLVPVEDLEAYGYPCPDEDDPSLRKAPLGKDGQKQHLRTHLASSYTCERCAKLYRIDDVGLPIKTTGKCIYHAGHLWTERINRSMEKRYSCCKGDESSGGCCSNLYHVHKGELELANFKGYVCTQPKLEKEPNKHGIYALDCEMCYTTVGLELTRVTVINHKETVVYEKLVKPLNLILDYNTKFSGIKDGDLENVKTTLADVQRDLLNMFSSKTILIGHSLDSDMKALKIFHNRFIDTAHLFPHKRGLPYKRALRTLMMEHLNKIIQEEDAGHDSKEDASAAFRLVMWRAKTDVPEKSK